MSQGPACPACGHTYSDISDSRFDDGSPNTDDPIEPTRRRRRRCRGCAMMFSTHEIVTAVYSSGGQAVEVDVPDEPTRPEPRSRGRTRRRIQPRSYSNEMIRVTHETAEISDLIATAREAMLEEGIDPLELANVDITSKPKKHKKKVGKVRKSVKAKAPTHRPRRRVVTGRPRIELPPED